MGIGEGCVAFGGRAPLAWFSEEAGKDAGELGVVGFDHAIASPSDRTGAVDQEAGWVPDNFRGAADLVGGIVHVGVRQLELVDHLTHRPSQAGCVDADTHHRKTLVAKPAV